MSELWTLGPEEFLDVIEEQFKQCEITEEEEWSHIKSYVQNSNYGRAFKNLLQRMDWKINNKVKGRSRAEFMRDIGTHTKKEAVLTEALTIDLIRRGHACTWSSNGIDPTGERLVVGEENIGRSDVIITIDDWANQLADMKNSPVNFKATFKVLELNNILRCNGNMLLFVNTGFAKQELRIQASSWAILGPLAVKSLLTLRKSTNYPGMGGKNAVMIGHGGEGHIPFDRLFKLYRYGDDGRFTGPSNEFVDFGYGG
jgi:hypothetical protein